MTAKSLLFKHCKEGSEAAKAKDNATILGTSTT